MATESVSEEVTREQIAAMDFPALLTKDEIEELDATNRSWGPTSRVLLAVLTRSRAQLLKPFDEDPDSAADTFIAIRDQCVDYRRQLQIMMEQADVAQARLEAVMHTVLQQQEAQPSSVESRT